MKNIKDHIKYFEIYDELYELTDAAGELEICQKCLDIPCELSKKERVTFLPYEELYIQNRYSERGAISRSCATKGITTRGACPFLNSGRCNLHQLRPIDCRSYPLTPFFGSEKTWQLKISPVCQYASMIPNSFVDLMLGVWGRLVPHLDLKWRISYNKRQPLLKDLFSPNSSSDYF
jgi:Fe-S-cluster containining protein